MKQVLNGKNWLSRRWLWWFAAVLLTPVLVIGALFTYEVKSEWFPRLGLPAFAHERAKLLPPEKRAAYEQELFSELQMWNMGSRKYPKAEDIPKREQRWQEMADDGFELAHITLRVLQPSAGLVFSLRGPMNRLEELARQGDLGAMCLMPGLVGKATVASNTDAYKPIYKKWLETGTAKGHPECMTQLGGRLILGADGLDRDVSRGLDLEFSARRAGYIHDVGVLVIYYQGKDRANTSNLRRLYCWLQIEAQKRITDAPQRFLAQLGRESHIARNQELALLYAELAAKRFELQDCVNLGVGD